MIPSFIPRWLVGIAVAATVPSIACFGFYTLDAVGEVGRRWPMLVILAYPVALIALISLVATSFSAQRTKPRALISAICFVAPALFLLLIRL